MRAGVDCVAITDHNSGAWVDRLKEALEELRRDKPRKASPNCIYSPASRSPLAVQCMSLALFDSHTTTEKIAALLGEVGLTGTFGRSDDVTTKSFPEVISEMSETAESPFRPM